MEPPGRADIPVGALIRACPQARKRTQADIAAGAGIQLRYLEMIEQGVRIPSLETLARIADALGVPPSMLIDSTRLRVVPDFGPVEAALLHPAADATPRRLAQVERAHGAALGQWDRIVSHFKALLLTLPDLLQDAAYLAQCGDERSRRDAIDIYRLIEAVLQYGRPDLSGEAAARAYALETGFAVEGGSAPV